MRRRVHALIGVAVAVAFSLIVLFAYLRGNVVPANPLAVPGPSEIVPEEVVAPAGEARAQVEVPILVYHHIRPDPKGRAPRKRSYYVTPEEFAAQVAYLKEHGYETIGFAQLRAAFDGGPLPAKPVILTFDDGRGTQYEAWKTLRANGFNGTWFVFTNGIDRPDYLTWAQLREILDDGGEVESHTLYHPYLTKASDEELAHEMTRSREMLKSHLGVESSVVAYPFGLTNARVVAAAEAAGYAMGRGLKQTSVQRADAQFMLGGYIATGDMRQFTAILERK